MKNQDRKVAPGSEPLPRGREVTGQDIGFADSIIAEKAISCLGIGPVLTCPRRRRTNLAGKLFQQLSQPLTMAGILEVASHHFILYPRI